MELTAWEVWNGSCVVGFALWELPSGSCRVVDVERLLWSGRHRVVEWMSHRVAEWMRWSESCQVKVAGCALWDGPYEMDLGGRE